jgi:hypothetical protein
MPTPRSRLDDPAWVCGTRRWRSSRVRLVDCSLSAGVPAAVDPEHLAQLLFEQIRPVEHRVGGAHPHLARAALIAHATPWK